MRDYGKVFSRIWESADFRSLTEDGRALVMYLLTCQHGTIAGVFRVPDGYACEDLQWTPERVAEGFANLGEKGFATRCEVTKWVWVTKFLEWNPPENPNQRKAAAKVAHSIPDGCAWKPDFMRVCGPLLGFEPAENSNPSATLAEPFLNQEQEQKQKQKSSSPPAEPPGFTSFWRIWPKSDRKEAKGKCLQVWLKANLEPLSAVILAHVESKKLSAGWTKQNGEFIPAPLVYLNGRKWEGAEVEEAHQESFV